MDRHSFLSSLDFLAPSSDHAWPPRVLTDACSTRGHHDSVRIENHYLSIEATDISASDNNPECHGTTEVSATATTDAASIIKNLGALSFESNRLTHKQFSDPALTKCHVDFYRSQPSSSIENNGTSTETTQLRSPPKYLSADEALASQQPVMGCLTLCCNAGSVAPIDEDDSRVYYLDWTQITDIQIISGISEGNVPPCLLLYFPSVLFRIFALPGESNPQPSNPAAGTSIAAPPVNGTLDETNSVDLYHSLQDHVNHLFRCGAIPIIPRISVLESPVTTSGSSGVTGSGDQPGAQQTTASSVAAALAAEALDAKNEEPNNETKTATPLVVSTKGSEVETTETKTSAQQGQHQHSKPSRINPVEARIQGNARALEQCHAHLSSLATLLELPHEVTANFPDFTEHLNALMTTAADDLVEAYVRPSDLEIMKHRHEEKMSEQKEKLQEALNAFFPVPRGAGGGMNGMPSSSQMATQQSRRKRQRRSKQQLFRNGENDGVKEMVSMEETRDRVEDLLGNFQSTVKERHALLCLPARGGTSFIG